MKLEDIPKKNVFKEPEGYFDKLPGVIQSRIAEKAPQPFFYTSWGVVLKYALPAFIAGIALLFILRSNNSINNPEELLASVSSEELTYYLVESDLSTEELLDIADLDGEDIDALNESVFYQDFDSELLEEYADELEL